MIRRPRAPVTPIRWRPSWSLAEEFHAIGDTDGARALVEEVVSKASGWLKAKAQRFLAELG